jgi:small GTP-binding protein
MSEKAEPKIIVKLLLLGDSSVGKTSIIIKYISNKFMDTNIATLGVDYMDKTVDYNNLKVFLQIWDTSGEEKFRSITRNFYRNADGLLVVFDLTCKESFNHVKNWINEAKEHKNDIKTILVGNKLDLEDEREVDKETALKFAEKNNLKYLETSAKNGKNINNSFKEMIALILNDKTEQEIKKEFTKSDSSISINSGKDGKKIKKSCC